MTVVAAEKKVTFVTLVLSHYRVQVHERIRELLAERGIEYQLLYSDPTGNEAKKNDSGTLAWAKKIPLKSIKIAGKEVHYQSALKDINGSDLVIVSQENKLLLNYVLLARSYLTGRKMAFLGHGRGYQSRNPNGFLEKWKRLLARQVYWWFAYTEGVSRYLQSIGFPETRITNFNNSIDTRQLTSDIEAVTQEDELSFRSRLGIKGADVAVFMGGMYEEKRLGFLCEAALKIREQNPEFELLLIGNGSHADIAEKYARAYPFIHAPGPMFGKDRAAALKTSKVFLMPGLVGLAVIDSFVAECPLVTTSYPHHSPEIEYLQSNENGLVVDDDGKPETYAKAVCELLADEERRIAMKRECRESAKLYSAENMAQRIAGGMIRAIDG